MKDEAHRIPISNSGRLAYPNKYSHESVGIWANGFVI